VQDDDDDEPLMFDEEDEEEKLRKKREAILAKYKNKGATSSPAVAPAAAAADATAPKEEPASEAGKAPRPGNGKADGEGGGKGEGGDDMFTDSPVRPIGVYNGNGAGAGEHRGRMDDGTGEREESGIDFAQGFTNADNWDDAEGYFRTRPGELIISRYRVNRDIGAGVYSTVVSAADEKNGGREVAIKIVVCLLHLPHSLRAPFWNVLAVLLVACPVCVLAPNAWRCFAAGRLAYDAAGAWD
jgi:hypothetical protein